MTCRAVGTVLKVGRPKCFDYFSANVYSIMGRKNNILKLHKRGQEVIFSNLHTRLQLKIQMYFCYKTFNTSGEDDYFGGGDTIFGHNINDVGVQNKFLSLYIFCKNN